MLKDTILLILAMVILLGSDKEGFMCDGFVSPPKVNLFFSYEHWDLRQSIFG